MRRLLHSSLVILLFSSWPLLSSAAMLFDWNEPGNSGHTWSGWTWLDNVDGFGSPGWRRNDAVDRGGGEWRPRSFVKDDCGAGTTAAIDTTTRAPSTTAGASLRLSNTSGRKVCWWGMIADDVFFYDGYTDATTNRFSFYVKYQGVRDGGLRTSDPDDNTDEIGTYLFPDHRHSNGNEIAHYYHHINVVNDIWLHVVLDRHPQHERGVSPAPIDDPKGPTYPYYRNFASFYWDTVASTVWFDEVRFWTQSQPENDVSVSSVWVGFRPADRRWLLSFMDSSWRGSYGETSVGTYEVRWSTAPITNDNWSSATPVAPLYNAASGSGSGPGRIRRPNSWKQIAYTEFQLPAGTEQANTTVYFAIKDVSSTSFGDGHNSPSPYIKTIHYALSPSSLSFLPPPQNLRVLQLP